MAYVTPSTVTAGTSPITAAAQNIIVNDIINLRGLANVQQTLLTSSLVQTVSTTYTNLTGLSVSITPTSATSKILVHCFCSTNQDSGTMETFYRLARDGTGILIGDAAGSRIQCSVAATDASDTKTNLIILDSPATTSTVTYTLQARGGVGNATVYLNRSKSDANAGSAPRSASTIIVQEIPT